MYESHVSLLCKIHRYMQIGHLNSSLVLVQVCEQRVCIEMAQKMYESWSNEGPNAARFKTQYVKPRGQCKSEAWPSSVAKGAKAKSASKGIGMSCVYEHSCMSSTLSPIVITNAAKLPPPPNKHVPCPPPPPWLSRYQQKSYNAMSTKKMVLKVLQSKGVCLVRGEAAIVPESEILDVVCSDSYTSENLRTKSEWSTSP